MGSLKENPYAQFTRYELRNLLAHLEDAGKGYETHSVLLRESKIERSNRKRNWIDRIRGKQDLQPETYFSNAWYEAHDDIGETESYLADVSRCWRLAEQESAATAVAEERIATVAFEVRYALITSSVNNLAKNIPPPLLARVIQQGLITTCQGLTYARQIPDLRQRALSLVVTAMEMEASSRELVLDEALATAATIADHSKRAQTLVTLAGNLDEAQLHRAVDFASDILFQKDRCQVLTAIVLHLSGTFKKEVLEQASATLEQVNDDHDKTECLISLAASLSEPLRIATYERALSLLEKAEPNYRRTEAIEKFIRQCPISLLNRALSIALEIENEESRFTVLSPLSARLASERDEEGALRLIQSISGEKYGLQRATALRESAPYLSPAAVRRAVRMALDILVEEYCSIALVGIIPYVPEDLLPKVLTTAKSMKEGRPRAQVLTVVALRLTEKRKEEVLSLAVEALQRNLSYEQADVLTDLAPQLSGSLLNLLFESARKINDRAQQVQTVADLARSLPVESKSIVLRQGMEHASSLQDLSERSETYLSLIPLLVDLSETKEALRLAWTMRPWTYCARGVSAVLPNLDDSEKGEQLQKMLTLLEKAGDESQLAEIIPAIASQLNEEMLEQALTLALRLKWEGGKVAILTSLTPFTPEPLLRSHFFNQTEHASSAFFKYKLQVAIATRLAQLGNDAEALAFVRSMNDELYLVNAFEALIPYLREEALSQVLKWVESFSYEGRQHAIFAMLAPRFAELGNEEVAGYLIARTRSPLQAALAAACVAQHATGILRADAIQHALTIIRNMQGAFGEGEGWWQAQCLSCIAPFLSYELMVEAWRLAVRIDERNDRQRALSSLAAQVTQLPLASIYPLWTSTLHDLATRSRQDLLSDLKALSPVILKMSRTDGAAQIIGAIDDACRWW